MNITESQKVLFLAKTARNGECLEWQGASLKSGYGIFRIGSRSGGSYRTALAHRVGYFIAFGPIQEGGLICHKCDNPKCVNPDHLFAGTHLDNVSDMISKGRRVVSSAKGESNPRAVITKSMAKDIRLSAFSCRKLAQMYGISKTQISRIKTGKAWTK